MQQDYLIRFAVEKDIPFILRLVHSLAEHARLRHEVSATEFLLAENIFKHRYAEAIIAETASAPVGYALFFHTFSSFLGKPGLYMEDLVIEESCRGKGCGKQMLSFLARLAVDRGCGRLEWSVLDWDKRAIHFYRSIGAAPMDQARVYRLSGPELAALAQRCNNP